MTAEHDAAGRDWMYEPSIVLIPSPPEPTIAEIVAEKRLNAERAEDFTGRTHGERIRAAAVDIEKLRSGQRYIADGALEMRAEIGRARDEIARTRSELHWIAAAVAALFVVVGVLVALR